MTFDPIHPKKLAGYVNFNSEEAAWNYLPDQKDMYNVQARGSARVWNLLTAEGIALLADEVGMGKTIQALAVMVTLWRQDPDARILIYVPNEGIARKWINEYTNFIRAHYRHPDGLLKSSDEALPIKEACYCANHFELLRNSTKPNFQLFICKISSLSHIANIQAESLQDISVQIRELIDYDPEDPDHQRKWMQRVGRASNRFLCRQCKNKSPFQLLLIDESHYLRTINRIANRSVAAKAFFKNEHWDKKEQDKTRPIAAMTLLMTATPNHSRAEDIRSVLGFFKPALLALSPNEILKKLCVRRFRRLQGLTKHQYRKEIPQPVALESLPQKLFFAAYQKSLVSETRQKNQTHGQLTQPYRILFGYLEGFEFLYRQTNYQDLNKKQLSDFEAGDDRAILERLVADYHQAYGSAPRHPKYDQLIRDLTPIGTKQEYQQEKALVFVRRIPSVFEISRRAIDEYDKWLLQLIEKYLPKSLTASFQSYKKEKNWPKLRRFFNKLRSHEEGQTGDQDEPEEAAEENLENIPSSVVLELFVIKRNHPSYRTTDCSNFKVRLSRRESVFSLFFQPAADYAQKPYNRAFSVKNTGPKGHPYLDLARAERFDAIEDENQRHYFYKKHNLNSGTFKITRSSKKTIPDTLLGLWWAGFGESGDRSSEAKEEYVNWSFKEKEAFSGFLQKGIVQASPFIVHLYCFFKAIETPNDNISNYRNFCKKVGQVMNNCGLRLLINDAILSFKVFYKKEMAMNEEELNAEKWNLLNASIPVYPYCGSTKRPSMIKAFNTPFFPNIMVATSVLQEGVDLHYHCSRIIHYGMAWTPGDNEQRIGRVDRIMGRLDEQLKQKDQNIHLPIYYPYLAGTLDEDQVSRYVKRKFTEEELIDQLQEANISKELNLLEDPSQEDWKRYFRVPEPDKIHNEPFGVEDSDFDGIEI